MSGVSLSFQEHVCVVKVQGHFQQPQIDDFKTILYSSHDAKEVGAVIVDCSTMTKIGSPGMQAMYAAQKDYVTRGQKFLVAGLKGDVRETFKISGIDALLNLCETVDTARQITSAQQR